MSVILLYKMIRSLCKNIYLCGYTKEVSDIDIGLRVSSVIFERVYIHDACKLWQYRRAIELTAVYFQDDITTRTCVLLHEDIYSSFNELTLFLSSIALIINFLHWWIKGSEKFISFLRFESFYILKT